MDYSILLTLGLGFALGLKHAVEPDHVAAVSTIVSEGRSMRQSAAVGALWGIGHTASLLAAGVLVVVMGFAIPESLANLLELAVALMIILLGTRVLYFVLTGERPAKGHSHRGRPLMVGVLHGLAGSAALTVFVLAQIAQNGSAALGLIYLAVFGAGSIGGMLLMSCAIGLPFSLSVRLSERGPVFLRLLAGMGSTAFGFIYAWGLLW